MTERKQRKRPELDNSKLFSAYVIAHVLRGHRCGRQPSDPKRSMTQAPPGFHQVGTESAISHRNGFTLHDRSSIGSPLPRARPAAAGAVWTPHHRKPG